MAKCCPDCGKVISPRATRCLSCATKAAWQSPKKREHFIEGIKRRSEDENWRAAKHFQRGAAHPRFAGGKQKLRAQEMAHYEYKAWRVNVFKRDGYQCQDCGQHGGNLIAHHIQRWADFPELRYEVSNGITLCAGCHDTRHGWARRPKTYKCAACGNPKKSSEGELCRSCSNKANYPADQRVKLRPCAHCSKLFKPRTPQSRFCSRSCLGAASRVRIVITCAYCGKSVERRPSDIQSEATYCSRSCCVRAVKPRLKRASGPGG